jgi:hypothetical protein
MLIPARNLSRYLSATTFPIPMLSEDGKQIVRYLQSAEEVIVLAARGSIVGRGTHRRLRSVQANVLVMSQSVQAQQVQVKPRPSPGGVRAADSKTFFLESLSCGAVYQHHDARCATYPHLPERSPQELHCLAYEWN